MGDSLETGVADAGGFDPATADRADLPQRIVVYLRTAERIAALVPTASFAEDLAQCRRKVALLARTLDAAPRQALREALEAAGLEVDPWWNDAAPSGGTAIAGG